MVLAEPLQGKSIIISAFFLKSDVEGAVNDVRNKIARCRKNDVVNLSKDQLLNLFNIWLNESFNDAVDNKMVVPKTDMETKTEFSNYKPKSKYSSDDEIMFLDSNPPVMHKTTEKKIVPKPTSTGSVNKVGVHVGNRIQFSDGKHAPKRYGTVTKVFMTTFGGKVRDWGCAVEFDKPFLGKQRGTYREKNIRDKVVKRNA